MPLEERAGDEVESGETADEERRAPERVDETSQVETTTTTPGAPQSASLEGECAPQASDGSVELTRREPDQAKATRDQGQTTTTTSASARSASCDHPTETETTTDLGRPSEDPAEATGDDERHPDEPTEPPDKPEGAGRRDGEQSVEEVESSEVEVLRASTEGVEAVGDDGDEERRPGKPEKPPDRPPVESTEPADIQVEPGGETDAERNGSVAHESADAGVDGEVVGMCQDVQDEAERSRTRRGDPIEGERPSALAHGQSTRADEDDQRTQTVDDDVPEGPPEPPPPPDEPAQRPNVPPSVELEGERKLVSSSEDARTSDEADALGASGHVEDTWKQPKELRNALERLRERSEQGEEENSPRSAPGELDEPNSETAVPGGIQRVQECPTGVRDECVVETNALRREPRSGGHAELQEASRGVEGVRDRRKVVEGADCDGIGLGIDGNERGVETNALRRVGGPGGTEGEQEAMGDVEADWDRRNDGEGGGYDGRWWGMDGATSVARRDSERVETDALAEYQASQHEQRRDATRNVPGPSTPLPNHHRRPHTHPNPPRRRGRMKTRPTSVSNPRWTHQIIQTR